METFEVTWLDARETISLDELSRACGMDADALGELVDYGALAPVGLGAQGTLFSAGCIVQLRTVCKLRADYDLDVFTLAMLMGYLGRIAELEGQLRSLRASAA